MDGGGTLVANASVSATLMRNGLEYETYSGTTGANGAVIFKVTNAPSGSYSTTVTAVTAPGDEWDGITPDNFFTK